MNVAWFFAGIATAFVLSVLFVFATCAMAMTPQRSQEQRLHRSFRASRLSTGEGLPADRNAVN